MNIDFTEAMLERGRSFMSYVNLYRAIPDIRDGLLTGQRRILFAMGTNHNHADNKPRKAARTIGEVIGVYHPHGDSAVYESMVLMAQDFNMGEKLIEGIGAWGSLNAPKKFGAMRYTEARLARITTDCLKDLHPRIVPYRPNFDETTTEAELFPFHFPNLLVNGAQAIGYALATNIPTHNLGEVVDATLLYLSDEDVSLKKLMKKLPAPDFPTGGEIVDTTELTNIYTNGSGSFKLRGRYTIEQDAGNVQAVVFHQLPYKIGVSQAIASIKAAAQDQKIVDLTEDPKDLSDGNVRLRIRAKRGANIQRLLADLFKHTVLEVSISVNMTVLVDEQAGLYPRQVGLVRVLAEYVKFRQDVLRKRLEYRREELMKKIFRDGAILATTASDDIIEKVVKLIRKSKDDDSTRAGLIKLLKWRNPELKKMVSINEEQAQWIMDLALKRINQLNRFQIQEKFDRNWGEVVEIDKILKSKDGIKNLLIEELKDVKKTWSRSRMTVLGSGMPAASGNESVSAPAGAQEVTLWYSKDGRGILQAHQGRRQAAKAPLAGKGLLAGLATKTDRQPWAITVQGVAYRFGLMDLPMGKGAGTGFVPMSADDAIAHVTDELAPYYLFVTRSGIIKRIARDVLEAAHAGGVIVMNIQEGDEIISVLAHEDKYDVAMASSQGQLLRTPLDPIRLVGSGKAGGVAGMKLKDGDYIVNAFVIAPDATGDLLILHADSLGKRTKIDEFPIKGRGTAGVRASDVDKPTKKPAGLVQWVGILRHEVEFVDSQGNLFAVDPKTVPQLGRAIVVKKLPFSNIPSGIWS